MSKIDDLIKQNIDNAERVKKLKYVGYLYTRVATEENVEDLDELVDTLISAYNAKEDKTVKIKDDILSGFYDFLLKTGKRKSVAYDYTKRMDSICRSLNITPSDVYYQRSSYSIDDLVGMYSFGGIKYEENVKKHNALSSALKRFKEYMENDINMELDDDYLNQHVYLCYDEGYRSFEQIDRHVCHFEIDDRKCFITYKENRTVCDTEKKIISEENYAKLIAMMNTYKHILAVNQTPSFIEVPFGGVGSYQYEFSGKINHSGCSQLFESEDRALLERAYASYRAVINDIIEQ